jgi:hypothetical protein
MDYQSLHRMSIVGKAPYGGPTAPSPAPDTTSISTHDHALWRRIRHYAGFTHDRRSVHDMVLPVHNAPSPSIIVDPNIEDPTMRR